MLAAAGDVVDQRARVQRRLVGPDLEHREPRVVGDSRIRHAGRGRLLLGIGCHEPLEQTLVERSAAPQVADQQRCLCARDRHSAAHRPQLHEQLLAEEMAERERIGGVGGAVADAHIHVLPRPRRAGQQIVCGSDREHTAPAGLRRGIDRREPRGAVRTRDERQRRRFAILPPRNGHRSDRSVRACERCARTDRDIAVHFVEKKRLVLLLVRQDQRDLLAGAGARMRRFGGRPPSRDERDDPAHHVGRARWHRSMLCARGPCDDPGKPIEGGGMAGRFEATVVIDRPIEEVFAFLADGENDPKFSPRVLEIAKTTDGPPGVGTVYASTVKDAGMKTKREFKLTEFERADPDPLGRALQEPGHRVRGRLRPHAGGRRHAADGLQRARGPWRRKLARRSRCARPARTPTRSRSRSSGRSKLSSRTRTRSACGGARASCPSGA